MLHESGCCCEWQQRSCQHRRTTVIDFFAVLWRRHQQCVTTTWTILTTADRFRTHEFDMVLKHVCSYAESTFSWCLATDGAALVKSKQLETCTENQWQPLNMSELSESPTTSAIATSQSTLLSSSHFTRVSFVCHVLRITLFSWCALPMTTGEDNKCKCSGTRTDR